MWDTKFHTIYNHSSHLPYPTSAKVGGTLRREGGFSLKSVNYENR